MLSEELHFSKSGEIYIFGAHSRAQTLGVYLMTLHSGVSVKAYLVDNNEDNPAEIDGIPVINLNTFPASGAKEILDLNAPVYLGTRGVYHHNIAVNLRNIGFNEIIPVTPNLDIELRNRYVKIQFEMDGREFVKLSVDGEEGSWNTTESACVYIARSIYDSPLCSDYDIKSWEKYIQVGKTLTTELIPGCTVFDDAGDNISDINRQFCELTALYWIWKNSVEDIVGVEHYRRRFLLGADTADRMINESIDVILPVPLYVYPSLAENYRMRHKAEVWDAMMDELGNDRELFIEAEAFFEKTGLYSPCNMLIANRKTFNELSEWLFPILFNVAEKIGELPDTYQNRYPGFLSERLITFYFYYYRDKYNVAYADKNFLG